MAKRSEDLFNPNRSSSRLYWVRGDESLIVVKSVSLAKSQTESEIANLVSSRHPLIASPIGFAESTAPRPLKIAWRYAVGDSPTEVPSDAPSWWTPMAKAKAIAGIALGLRSAHGLGLLHRGLKASNVLFDADQRIQIADFSPIRLEAGDAEPFAGEGGSPAAEVCAFAPLLFEIAVGCLHHRHIHHQRECLIPASRSSPTSALIGRKTPRKTGTKKRSPHCTDKESRGRGLFPERGCNAQG
jgi:hypothetical protein